MKWGSHYVENMVCLFNRDLVNRRRNYKQETCFYVQRRIIHKKVFDLMKEWCWRGIVEKFIEIRFVRECRITWRMFMLKFVIGGLILLIKGVSMNWNVVNTYLKEGQWWRFKCWMIIGFEECSQVLMDKAYSCSICC